MSSSVEIRRRPGLWSYLSWNSSSTATRNRRSSSGSLPTQHTDPSYSKYHHPRAHMLDNSNNSMHYRQRMRYYRTGGIIAFILFAVYLLLPGQRHSIEEYVGKHSQSSPQNSKDAPIDPSLGTTRCSKSYSSHKPLVQYVLMIDAGSTGSRIHVYKFNNCGPTPELEDEVFKQTPKKEGGSGLSSYREDAEGAAQSLDVLLDVAMEKVPDNVKGCTPVAVKATAGLRKLGEDLSNKILKAVRHRLETKYPFPVVSDEKGGVEVMDGKYEGVYAWITTNYLLGKIGGPDESPTAAIFDLGGGSTQIVFEPNFKRPGGGMPKKLSDGDHKYDLNFGGRSFSLYQHSYLGYGLMAARNNIHALIIDALHKENPSDKAWLEEPIVNPCIIPGMSREVEVELQSGHSLGSTVKVKMVGPKEASTSQCQALAERTLKKDAQCKLHPCAFDGIHQPSLEQTFAKEDIYLFSYFYDRIKPLGVPENFTLRDLKDLTHRVCQGKSSWDVFRSIEGAMDELKGRPESCLDLNFLFSLLHLGYEMPLDREVKIAKKIKGNELGWCLGASLPLLEQTSGWKCKINEVK